VVAHRPSRRYIWAINLTIFLVGDSGSHIGLCRIC